MFGTPTASNDAWSERPLPTEVSRATASPDRSISGSAMSSSIGEESRPPNSSRSDSSRPIMSRFSISVWRSIATIGSFV
ncbi:MAG: hypothetical protein D6692_04290 [Planctomycetota bacterium]|nr:MAG: hypothetical protein D6692_04290 [Planctomycetota bacterium]